MSSPEPNFLNFSLRIGAGVLALFVFKIVEFACGSSDQVQQGFEAIVVSSKIIKNYYIEVSNLTFSDQF